MAAFFVSTIFITQTAWVYASMPTILKLYGCRVVIYPNDHRPAHVHVIGNGCEEMFRLNCPDGPPDVRENYEFSARDLNRIAAGLDAELSALCTQWRMLHEYY